MEALSLAQAIRNAIGAEESVAKFYQTLSERLDNHQVKGFFATMADDERGHATALCQLAGKLTDEHLPEAAEAFYEQAELPGVSFFVGDFDLRDALYLALDGEYRARDFYQALADDADGSLASFFKNIAAAESRHAVYIQTLLDEEVSK